MTSYDGTTPKADALSAKPNNEGIDAAVAAARRLVSSLLHSGDHTAADMADVAAKLEAIVEHLDEHAPSRQERLVNMWSGEGVTRHDPVTGPENTIAPPLHIMGCDDGSVQAKVTLGLPYQGPPGCVHGGVSAMLLDHLLGVANHWGPGPSGMTGTLTLRYHRPTPLFEELTLRGKQEKVDGRKIFTNGTLSNAAGEVCVSAEGLFIAKHIPRPR